MFNVYLEAYLKLKMQPRVFENNLLPAFEKYKTKTIISSQFLKLNTLLNTPY